MKQFLARRWFLLALTLVLAVGFAFAAPLSPWVGRLPRNWIVASVMFLMALPLDLGRMTNALRRPKAVLLAVGVNALLTPLFAWALSSMQSGDLAVGLMIAASVPCTIASAAVWTRKAGGDDAVALLVTMITNSLCFL
ncbi:MAG: bile acid:sodium symporter, partial [Planctomycetales bacterium]